MNLQITFNIQLADNLTQNTVQNINNRLRADMTDIVESLSCCTDRILSVHSSSQVTEPAEGYETIN